MRAPPRGYHELEIEEDFRWCTFACPRSRWFGWWSYWWW